MPPIELKLTFCDGSTDVVKVSVDVWNPGNQVGYRVPEAKAVTPVELDPRRVLPDIDRWNNRWRW